MKTIYVDDEVAARIKAEKSKGGDKNNSATLRRLIGMTKPPLLHLVEFPDFGELPFDPELLGLSDTSWHNDLSPSFSVVNGAGVQEETLWIAPKDPALREDPEYKRFQYMTYEPSGEHNEPLETLLDTDDEGEAAQFLHSRLVQRIGDRFAHHIRKYVGKKKFGTVCQRNAAQTDPSICHSHDFCDANMMMDAALRDSGFAAMLDAGDWASKEENAHLWNMAWDYAKAKHLTAPRAK